MSSPCERTRMQGSCWRDLVSCDLKDLDAFTVEVTTERDADGLFGVWLSRHGAASCFERRRARYLTWAAAEQHRDRLLTRLLYVQSLGQELDPDTVWRLNGDVMAVVAGLTGERGLSD